MKKKGLYIVTGIVILLSVLYFGGKAFVFRKIEDVLRAQADSLRSKGFTVDFDSLQTSSWSNSISVSHVSVVFPGKSCNDTTSRFTAEHLEVNGISLFAYVLHHEVKISLVAVQRPYYLNDGETPAKKEKKSSPSKINQISVERFQIVQGRVELMDSGYCRLKQRDRFTVEATDITVLKPGSPEQKINLGSLTVSKAQVELPMKFYTVALQQLSYRGGDRSVRVDSLTLIPWYDNITFVRKTGVQTDRVDLKIPLLEITGLESLLSGSDTVRAKRIEFNFTAEVFRDKRQPRGKQSDKKLISRMIHDIKLPLQIDSVIVGPSSVSYEEFQPSGNKSGTVTFEKLKATIGNFSTISSDPMTMKASARFMDAGNLHAFFTFPANPEKTYSVKGMLTDFELPKLNRILVPAANAEIKKGHLQSMMFNFEYNNFRSDGQLTLNYKDLDMVSLLKNKEQKEENKFLTLILKSFIVKKDMDRSKSTGTILFYRDTGKASFNFWWKSILSGVKSLYNLDKITDTHHSKKK